MTRRWLGLDIGGTKTLAAVFDDAGSCVAERCIPSIRAAGAQDHWARTIELAQQLAYEHGPIAAAGAGFAGIVDHERGVVVDSSVILPGWEGFQLAEQLSNELCIPAVADNDANAAGWGEYVLLGKPRELTLLVLTIGTGIGGAVILGGRQLRGGAHSAGEFGNMTIDWQSERPYRSRNRGALGGLASGGALLEMASDKGSPVDSVAELAERARAGDVVACKVIGTAARALGAGLANLVNAFNPDRITLAGGVTGLGKPWLRDVVAECEARAFPVAFRHVDIALSQGEAWLGALGVADMARHTVTEGAVA